MIFDFESLKGEVLNSLNKLKYEFDSKNSKVNYLLDLTNNIKDNDNRVVKSDGTDVTEKFLKSLRDLMEDELGREYLYVFKEFDRDNLFKSDGLFYRIPNFIGINSEVFSIFYIPDNIEIARSVITKSGDYEYTINFIELRKEYGKLSYFDILKDCIQEKYGNVDFKFDRDIIGKDKTGLKDKIPELKSIDISKSCLPSSVPEIKMEISDVKLKRKKDKDPFGGF